MDESTQRALMSRSSVEWNTPPDFLERVYAVLGSPVDLDPCSNATSVVRARVVCRLDLGYDGLAFDWRSVGRTAFVNPPYGGKVGRVWADKIAREAEAGVEIIALVPARTDTAAFQRGYLATCSAVCFVSGRVRFLQDGKPCDAPPFPSAVSYYGSRVGAFAEVFSEIGRVLYPSR